MQLKKPKTQWLALSVLISGCASVKVPNVEFCASAGARGAICQKTNSDDMRRLGLIEWLDFLDASAEKGPALCLSSNDFTKLKTALQTLCDRAGDRCTYEQKKAINQLTHIREGLLPSWQ